MLNAEVSYRIDGQRGPAKTLTFDADRIDPLAWLREHLGDGVRLVSDVRHLDDEGREGDSIPEPVNGKSVADSPARRIVAPSPAPSDPVLAGIRKLPVPPLPDDRPVFVIDDQAPRKFDVAEIRRAVGIKRHEFRCAFRGKTKAKTKEEEMAQLKWIIEHVGPERFRMAVRMLTAEDE